MEPQVDLKGGMYDRFGQSQNMPTSLVTVERGREFQHPVPGWRNPNDMMPRLNWDGDEAFKNNTGALIARFMDGLVLDKNDDFHTTRLLPILPVKSLTIQWEKVTYNDAIMQRTPYEAPSNYLTQSKERFSEVISRRGIAIFGENDWMATPEGMTDMLNLAWKMNLVRIKTMSLSVISACLGAKNMYRDWQERAGLYSSSIDDVFRYEKNVFAIVNKPTPHGCYAFKVMVDIARESVILQSKGTEPDMLILPPGIIGYYREPVIQELTTYEAVGPDGKREIRARPPPLAKIGGIDIYETHKSRGNHGEKNTDLLVAEVSVGEMCRLKDETHGAYPADYTSDNRSIMVYDEPMDEWEKITLRHALDGCFRFDKSKHQSDGGGLPPDDNDDSGLTDEAKNALNDLCRESSSSPDEVVDPMIHNRRSVRMRSKFFGEMHLLGAGKMFFKRVGLLLASKVKMSDTIYNNMQAFVNAVKVLQASSMPNDVGTNIDTSKKGNCCYRGIETLSKVDATQRASDLLKLDNDISNAQTELKYKQATLQTAESELEKAHDDTAKQAAIAAKTAVDTAQVVLDNFNMSKSALLGSASTTGYHGALDFVQWAYRMVQDKFPKSVFMRPGVFWSLGQVQQTVATNPVAVFCDHYLLPQRARAVFKLNTGKGTNKLEKMSSEEIIKHLIGKLDAKLKVACEKLGVSASNVGNVNLESMKDVVPTDAESIAVKMINNMVGTSRQARTQAGYTKETLSVEINKLKTAIEAEYTELSGDNGTKSNQPSSITEFAWWNPDNVSKDGDFVRDLPGSSGNIGSELHKEVAKMRLGGAGISDEDDILKNFTGRLFDQCPAHFKAAFDECANYDPLVRAFARAFMWTRMDYFDSWESLIESDIPLPVDFFGFRPNLRHRMKSVIMAKGGLETGATCVIGEPDIKQGNDAVTKTSMQHMTHHFGAMVWKPENLCVLRHVAYAGYVCGNAAKVYTRSASEYSQFLQKQLDDTEGTMIFAMVPLGSPKFKAVDIFGQLLHPDARKAKEAQTGGTLYVGYKFMANVLNLEKWDRQIKSNDPFRRTFRNQKELNTMCWQGAQKNWNHSRKDFVDYVRGCGHHGEWVFPGVAAARAGEDYAVISLEAFRACGYQIV